MNHDVRMTSQNREREQTSLTPFIWMYKPVLKKTLSHSLRCSALGHSSEFELEILSIQKTLFFGKANGRRSGKEKYVLF